MFALLLSLVGAAGGTTLTAIADTADTNWNPIVMSADGSKAAAAANDQIYLSVDGGVTWPRTNSRAARLAMSPDGSKLFGWTMMSQFYSPDQNIKMSTDDGQTTSDIGQSTSWNGVAASTDGTKLAGIVFNGNIQVSSDAGQSWTDTGVGPKNWYAVAMSGDGTNIAALDEKKGNLWISSDSGATFSEVDMVALAQAEEVMSNREWADIAMSTDGTKIAVCGQRAGVLVSQDSGASWIEGLPQDHRTYRGVGISDDGMIIVTTSNNDGIWISYDGGATFVKLEFDAQNAFQEIALSADGSKFIATAPGGSGGLYRGDVVPPTTTVTMTTMTNTTTTATTTGTTVTMTVTVTATSDVTTVAGDTTAMGDTTMAGTTTPPPNVLQVTLTVIVDDPTSITENQDVINAMITSFASLMNVDASQVTLEFQVARRLDTRRLQVTLLSIFSVTTSSTEEAEQVLTAIDTVSVADTSTAISDAVANAGFNGTITVTAKVAEIRAVENPPTSSCFSQHLAFVAGIVLLPFF